VGDRTAIAEAAAGLLLSILIAAGRSGSFALTFTRELAACKTLGEKKSKKALNE
jgi:hypothetical protein